MGTHTGANQPLDAKFTRRFRAVPPEQNYRFNDTREDLANPRTHFYDSILRSTRFLGRIEVLGRMNRARYEKQ